MNIRTVTQFIKFDKHIFNRIKTISQSNYKLNGILKEKGYSLQTTRITIIDIENKITSEKQFKKNIFKLNDCMREHNIAFYSIGSIERFKHLIPYLIEHTDASMCYMPKSINDIDNAVNMIMDIAHIEDGLKNFNFAVIFNGSSHAPFYPGSFAFDKEGFSIGLEWSDEFYTLSESKNLNKLIDLINDIENRVIELSNVIKDTISANFIGADMSLSPGLSPQTSIVNGYFNLMNNKWDIQDAMSITEYITKAIKSTKIKRVGYNGVMFSVLEDKILSEFYGNEYININDILTLSTKCGVGADTVPLPIDINKKIIFDILNVLNYIAFDKNKMLSARLLPLRCDNNTIKLNSPYLVNSIKCIRPNSIINISKL